MKNNINSKGNSQVWKHNFLGATDVKHSIWIIRKSLKYIDRTNQYRQVDNLNTPFLTVVFGLWHDYFLETTTCASIIETCSVITTRHLYNHELDLKDKVYNIIKTHFTRQSNNCTII